MEISFNETKLYTVSPKFWQYSILMIISLAFILSDWIVLYSSFGDFILAFGVFLLLCLGQIKITRKQLIILAIPITVLITTIVLGYFFNDYWLSNKRLLASSIKFVFYMSATTMVFNFIKKEKLENTFLKMSNVFAILSVIIGIGITILIYLELKGIYTLIWTFTRSDPRSFYYTGFRDVVRTRSLFSEPAHLGYYLNTVFFANIFYEKKSNMLVLTILAIGILLTLSYSMIFIFLVTGFTTVFLRIIKKEFKWNHWYWAIIILISGLLFWFWDLIYVSIIERTLNILSGDDGSANVRILGSWDYVVRERLLFGNGIGHTPPITNMFAYVLSDFGLIGFVPYIIFTLVLLFNNLALFVLFVTMNVSKGGYLNPAFWLFLLFIFLYGIKDKSKKKE